MEFPTFRDVSIAICLLAILTLVTPQSNAEPVLEEIVVTAQKREQSLQDVPLSVSAMSGEAMSDAGIDSLYDVSRHIPALEVQTNTAPVQSNFRIRRIGNLGNIPTFEPAVGVFIDGAFRSRSVFGVGDLFDLERIEILRGPQSTLYGKNTTGGVIGVYTKVPGHELEGRAELTVGRIEGGEDALTTRFKGGISGPIAESLSGSLGISVVNSEETIASAVAGGEDANDEERFAIRGQLQWDITEQLDARLIVAAVREDDKQDTEDLFYDPAGFIAGVILPTFEAAGVSQPCLDNDPHNRETCSRKAWTTDLETDEVTLLVDYGFSNDLTLSSITSWDSYEFRGTSDDVAQVMAPVLRFHDTQEGESFQQEFRLTSPGGETVDWLLGAFYFTNEYTRGDGGQRPMFLFDTLSADPTVSALNQALLGLPIPLPFATPGQIGRLDAEQETDYLAAYAQATWNISEEFTVTAGMRWQEEEKDAFVFQSVNDPSPSIISLLLSPPDVSGGGLNRKSDEVTWSVSPQWFVSDQIMMYGTVAHGFKSGGFNVGFGSLPIAGREFNDEDIMHYELGIKSELWGRRLRLAASVFYTEYEDYQDSAFVGAQFTVGNADTVELEGFEVEATVLIADNWTADFAVSYADLVYEENTSGQCFPGRTPDSLTTPGACDLSGEHPVNAPEWKTHLGLAYDRPVSWGELFGRLDWSWTDDYNTSFSADPSLTQDAYSWVNVRAGARWDRLEAIFWVENLLDEEVVNFDAVVNIYSGDNSYQSYLQAPRSMGLTVKLEI